EGRGDLLSDVARLADARDHDATADLEEHLHGLRESPVEAGGDRAQGARLFFEARPGPVDDVQAVRALEERRSRIVDGKLFHAKIGAREVGKGRRSLTD